MNTRKVGLCVDCKHSVMHDDDYHGGECFRQRTDQKGRNYDVVSGKDYPERAITGTNCQWERNGDPPACCGPFGQYWEMKP